MLATSLLAAQSASAGDVIFTPPTVPTAPPIAQADAINNEMNVFIPAGVMNPSSAQLFQFGPVILHPHVSYNILYSTGVQSGANNQQNTIVQQFAPGISAALGQHWSVDYTPTLNFYSSKEFKDHIDQSAYAQWATHYEDWNFGFSQNISASSDPTTETAAQTSQQSYNTDLTAGYAFNEKWAATMAVDQSISLVSSLQDSFAWKTTEGVNYQFWPRLNAGISLTTGYTKVETKTDSGSSNPDSITEQLMFNVNWRATDKVSFQVGVGAEDQQFLAAGYNDSLSPTFNASIQYQPFKNTQISLSASQSVSTSDYYVIAQSSQDTSVSLNLNQRVLVKCHLSLGLSYSVTEFKTSVESFDEPNRSDNNYSFNASFGRDFLKHGNWAITYSYGDNQSNTGGYSQASNQIGFNVSFSY